MSNEDGTAFSACVVYAPALSKPYVAYVEDLLTDKPDEAPDGYHLGGEGETPEDAIGHLQRAMESLIGTPCRLTHIRYDLAPTDDAHEGL